MYIRTLSRIWLALYGGFVTHCYIDMVPGMVSIGNRIEKKKKVGENECFNIDMSIPFIVDDVSPVRSSPASSYIHHNMTHLQMMC